MFVFPVGCGFVLGGSCDVDFGVLVVLVLSYLMIPKVVGFEMF